MHKEEPVFTTSDMYLAIGLSALGSAIASVVLFKKTRIKIRVAPIPMLHEGLARHMAKTNQTILFQTDVGDFVLHAISK